jgi:DNA polymerase-3 subunit epsilon
MTEYILFIDTEISDIPKQWHAPTSKVELWPYILQVAWTICRQSGEEVVTRDFYINPGNIRIGEESGKLHKITLELLRDKGVSRESVMQLLHDDLDTYRPMIVGHFLTLDRKMMEVSFNRSNIVQNFIDLPKFCTMRNTQSAFERMDSHRFMRLNELYSLLFGREMENQHNALADALATKECFFEQLRRGDITDETIQHQQRYFEGRSSRARVIVLILMAIVLIATLYFFIVNDFLK